MVYKWVIGSIAIPGGGTNSHFWFCLGLGWGGVGWGGDVTVPCTDRWSMLRHTFLLVGIGKSLGALTPKNSL